MRAKHTHMVGMIRGLYKDAILVSMQNFRCKLGQMNEISIRNDCDVDSFWIAFCIFMGECLGIEILDGI